MLDEKYEVKYWYNKPITEIIVGISVYILLILSGMYLIVTTSTLITQLIGLFLIIFYGLIEIPLMVGSKIKSIEKYGR